MKGESSKELFWVYQSDPPLLTSLFKKIIKKIRRRSTTFSFAIFLSFFIHMVLVGFLYFLQSSASISREKAVEDDYKAFAQAFSEMKDTALGEESMDELFSGLDKKDLLRILEGKNWPYWKLGKKEKVEFYKRLISSYSRLKTQKEAGGQESDVTIDDFLEFLKKESRFELNSGDKVIVSEPIPGKQNLRFYTLTKEKREKLKYLRKHEKREREYAEVKRNQVRVETETGIRYIPAEYYFRQSPYEEILAHGANLFYIVEGFPVLKKHVVSRLKDKTRRSHFPEVTGDDFMVIVLNEIQLEPESSPRPRPLQKEVFRLSGEQIEQALDGLMNLSENDQFWYFYEKYLKRYDANKGDLARFTREFLYNNLSNVIIVIEPVSAAFDFIEELYYNNPLDIFYPSFWEENPDTETGVEFLVCLAAHYDFERRCLVYLFDAYEEAEKLLNKKYYRRNAFNKKAKAYVVKEVYEELIWELKRRGYKSMEEVLERYRNEQMKIYRMIIEMGGSTKDRGLFALGRFFWDEGMYELALEKWDKIDESYPSKTFQRIMIILANFDDLDKIVPQVDGILNWESNQSSKYLLKRLLKYHRWKNRSKEEKAVS
jgi:hypothetical protein